MTSISTKALFVENIVLNILLAYSLGYLWAMVNALQIIGHLPLFSIYIPANALLFVNSIMDLQNFSFIPTAWLTNKIFNEQNGSFDIFRDLGPLFYVLIALFI